MHNKITAYNGYKLDDSSRKILEKQSLDNCKFFLDEIKTDDESVITNLDASGISGVFLIHNEKKGGRVYNIFHPLIIFFFKLLRQVGYQKLGIMPGGDTLVRITPFTKEELAEMIGQNQCRAKTQF